MMPVDLHFGLFTSNFSTDLSESIAILWLRAMAGSNLAWLREHPEATGPYSGKIKYIRECDTQHWLPIPELHRPRRVLDGNDLIIEECGGDCKDLATYAVAWYYRLGERMKAEALRRIAAGLPAGKVLKAAKILMSVRVDLVASNSGFFRYHVRCKWPNGKIEDPSEKLGMNVNGLHEIPTRQE
jgi:hypothetical protein